MDEKEHSRKKMQSEHAADEIRADELIKATNGEARHRSEKLRDIPVTNSNYWRFKGADRRPLPRGIKWGIAGLVVILVAGFVITFYVAKKNAEATLISQAGTLRAGVQDLQGLDAPGAAAQFSLLNGSSSPAGVLGGLMSLFGGNGGLIGTFGDLSNQLSSLATGVGNAENDIVPFISEKDGMSSTTFAGDLEDIRQTLTLVDADVNQLSGTAASIGAPSSLGADAYLSLKSQIDSAKNFLDAFVPWFSDASSTHHILVLFENPSELRPGGGFLGSYADVSLQAGRIQDVSVHDVADADIAFAPKIVPPVPLQLEETSWRPADGNWFFDFPTSASETIQLFEQSQLYSASSTTFDGAIAITPAVISDLLNVTGPLTIAGDTPRATSTTFTAENLTTQIQKIVQAGQAAHATGETTYPKKILGELASAIFAQLASSTSTSLDSQGFLDMALNWIANKDVVAYFKDADIENYIAANGAAGDVYQPPADFNGDYLAIANADINSDKSEAYVSQKINFDVEIGSDGVATDHLIIDRTHNGNQSPYWWYRTTNQDYMQVFVSPGTSLDNQSGGITKSVPAPINYIRSGYSTDPLLLAIQSSTQQNFSYPKVSTHMESGKEVFGVWSRVAAGATTELSFDYSHHLFELPAAGSEYQFVFDRQQGATGDYHFEISAPLGYVFAENDLATYTYEATSTMPGRLTINLTLQKL